MSDTKEKLYPAEAMTGATQALSEFMIPKAAAEWQTDLAKPETFAALVEQITTRTQSEGRLSRNFDPIESGGKSSLVEAYIYSIKDGKTEIVLSPETVFMYRGLPGTEGGSSHRYSVNPDRSVVRSDTFKTREYEKDGQKYADIVHEEDVPVSAEEMASLGEFIGTMDGENIHQARLEKDDPDLARRLRKF